ncbi:NKIRAS2 [Branchiostoma lanceolatum]|uniref:NKIRAS2 protein n=1 Tax=Branchiostoma lanceolatum TaxID=7740 RepID=A0A8J9ZCQ1_BRALA|nr:NKIRAS2 [Branchiostoma lanceolatum]
MGKTSKVVVCGQASSGKTAVLEQLIYGTHTAGSQLFATIEDIYVANIETDRGVREKIRFYDTAGLSSSNPELPKHYITLADGFVLVYSTTDRESFKRIDLLKRDIDAAREKKEVTVVAVGTKTDLKDRKVELREAQNWAQKEKVRLFEVSVKERKALMDPFVVRSPPSVPPPDMVSPFRSSAAV